jgi:membrane-bound metal-dependent hydrolase YbcI (DUF457 family)
LFARLCFFFFCLSSFVRSFVFFWLVRSFLFVFFLARLFACLFACLFARLFLRSLVCSFVCSFVRLFVCSLVCSFACFFVRLFACLFVCSFVRSFVCFFVCSLVRLFQKIKKEKKKKKVSRGSTSSGTCRYHERALEKCGFSKKTKKQIWKKAAKSKKKIYEKSWTATASVSNRPKETARAFGLRAFVFFGRLVFLFSFFWSTRLEPLHTRTETWCDRRGARKIVQLELIKNLFDLFR